MYSQRLTDQATATSKFLLEFSYIGHRFLERWRHLGLKVSKFWSGWSGCSVSRENLDINPLIKRDLDNQILSVRGCRVSHCATRLLHNSLLNTRAICKEYWFSPYYWHSPAWSRSMTTGAEIAMGPLSLEVQLAAPLPNQTDIPTAADPKTPVQTLKPPPRTLPPRVITDTTDIPTLKIEPKTPTNIPDLPKDPQDSPLESMKTELWSINRIITVSDLLFSLAHYCKADSSPPIVTCSAEFRIISR